MRIIFILLLYPLFLCSQEHTKAKIDIAEFPYVDITSLGENIYPVYPSWGNIDSLNIEKNENEIIFFDDDGSLIAKMIADKLVLYSGEDTQIRIDNNSCFIDEMPCKIKDRILKYDFALDFITLGYYISDIPYLKYRVSKKTGLVDYDGRIVTDTSNFNIHGFRNDLAQFKESEKWGFMNAKFEVVIPPTFVSVLNFNDNGLARASNEKFSGFINKKGEWVHKFDRLRLSYHMPFHGRYAVVRSRGDKYGYINIDGKLKVDTIYNQASSYREGTAVAKKDEIWGVLRNRKWIPMSEYQELKIGHNGFILAKKEEKWGIVDKKNRIILPFKYEELIANEPFIIFKNKTGWGAFNNEFEIVIESQYERITSYRYGFFTVKKKNKYGFVDLNNEVVIPMVFDFAFPFTPYGRSIVKVDGKYELIDRQGNFLSTENWIEHQERKRKTP